MLSSLPRKLFASYAAIAVLSVLTVVLASGIIVRSYQRDSQVRSLQAFTVVVRSSVQAALTNLKKQGELGVTFLRGGAPAVRARVLDDVADDAARIGVRLLVVYQGVVMKDSQGGLEGLPFTVEQRSRVNLNNLNSANNYGQYAAPDHNASYLYTAADIAPLTVEVLTNTQKPGAANQRNRTVTFGTLVVMQPQLNPWVGLFGPMLIAAGIALLLSLLAAWLLGRTISHPVSRLKAATAEIARGNYEHKIEVRGEDELAALGRSFNQMTTAVQRTQQSQREFLANISHDLKTPLTSIQGFSQAIMDGTLPDLRSQQGAARVINDEAQRMTRLVSTLLEISRLQSGQVPLKREQLDLGLLLQACVEGVEPQAQAKDVSLGSRNLLHLPPIVGDGDRLRQVFTNLVDNAIRHTPAGGFVEVEAEMVMTPPGVVIRVSDNGEGIPPQDLPRIFERFYQVEKARTSGGRGLGLGLWLVREVIAAHDGMITVASKPGHGTTFSVTLPASPRPQLPAPATLTTNPLASEVREPQGRSSQILHPFTGSSRAPNLAGPQ